jgi:hypothetical protein
MTRIVEHLSVEELEWRYRAAREVTEARHTQAIWLLAQGRTVLDVAGVLAFAPRWVEQLAARHDAHGRGVLGDQRRRHGRAARSKFGICVKSGHKTGPKGSGWGVSGPGRSFMSSTYCPNRRMCSRV